MTEVEHGAVRSSGLEAAEWGVQLAALTLLVLAPWSASNSYSSESGWIMTGGGLLLALYAVVMPWGRAHRLLPLGGLLMGCFLLWSVATWHWSLNPFYTQQRWATWLAAWAVLLVMMDMNRTRLRTRVTLEVLCLGSAAYAATSLTLTASAAAQHLGFHLNTLRFYDPDAFAALLMLGYGLCLGAALNREARTLPWIVAMAESAVIFMAILCSGSRTGICGAFLATVFLVWVAAKRRRRLLEILPVLTGPAIAFFCLAALVVIGNVNDPLMRFKQLVVTDDQSGFDNYERLAEFHTRGMIYLKAPRTVLRAPLVGAGLDNFALAFQQDRPRSDFKGYVNQGHCEILQTAVECGLVGLALWVAVWALALRQPVRRAQDSATSGAIAALVGMILFGLANFAQCIATDLLWIAALLGLALRDVREQMSSYPVPVRHSQRGAVALAATLLLAGGWLAVFGWRVVLANQAFSRAKAAENDYHWAQALTELGRAIDLRPGHADYHLERGLVWEKLGQSGGHQALMREADEEVEDAATLAPIERDIPLEVGLYYARRGRLPEGERVLKAAAQWYPQDYRRWLALGQLYVAENRLAEAAEAIHQAAPNSDDAVTELAGLLATLQASKQNAQGLLAGWQQADPDITGTWIEAGLRAAGLLAETQPVEAQRMLGQIGDWPGMTPSQRISLASLYVRLHRVDKATGLLHELLQSTDDRVVRVQPQALQTLIDAELATGRRTLAVKDLEGWLADNPWDNEARKRLGDIYTQAGNLAKAIAIYTEAVNANGSDPTLQATLGDLYLKNNEALKALDAYEEAARLAPDNATYAEKVKELSRL